MLLMGTIAMLLVPISSQFSLGNSSSRLLATRLRSTATRKATVVGGGLAGLSTAFHLLEKCSSIEVTIVDQEEVGCGGASSVAAGLVHPLSPRGKLAHWGIEGLTSTNYLISIATMHRDCVLAQHLYHLALSEQDADIMRSTAESLPEFCAWLDQDEIKNSVGSDSSNILGGLRLSNGCQAIHVPWYLEGLWKACLDRHRGRIEWRQEKWSGQDDSTVVYCAGAGLWKDSLLKRELPTQLVRGQLLELTVPAGTNQEPTLFGKYISPRPEPNKILLGATHEFREEPLSAAQVQDELRDRSYDAVPHLWDDDRVCVDQISEGTRVQSNRGPFGRLPIIGRLSDDEWIFTGLSSRGLLYHGVYGEILADAILQDSEDEMLKLHPHLGWWKNRKR